LPGESELSTDSGIFDPAYYADVRRPLLRARTLPGPCYSSQASYKREIKRILMCTRNFVDPIDAISNPGDRLAPDTFGGPIGFKRGAANCAPPPTHTGIAARGS
jgi:hypothetical protein